MAGISIGDLDARVNRLEMQVAANAVQCAVLASIVQRQSLEGVNKSDVEQAAKDACAPLKKVMLPKTVDDMIASVSAGIFGK